MSIDINALLDRKIEFPKTLDYFLYGGFILGLLTFLYTLSNGHADIAWTAFHLNFVFWAGVSHGGVLFACAMRITSSSWGRSIMRICESFAAFMPVVFIFLLVLLFIDGEKTLIYFSEDYRNYDYITSRKYDLWLNFNSVFIRSILLIGTLHILTYYYLYHSIKQDCEGTGRFKGFFSFLSSTPEEGKEVDHDNKLYKYSIAIAFAYSLSMTFIAFDFIMSLDAAAETHNRADYTALTTWGVFLNEEVDNYNIILLNSIKKRMEFPELKQLAMDEYSEWEPDSFIVEKKSAGTALYQEMRRMGIPVSEFTPHRGSGDKMARLNSVTDIVASGLVWVPETRWAEEVIEEIAGFPFMSHDDLVDATVMALMRFRQGGFIRLPSDEPEETRYFKRRGSGFY